MKGLPHYTTKSDVYEGQYIPEGGEFPSLYFCILTAIQVAWSWLTFGTSQTIVLRDNAHPLLRAMSRDVVKYPNPTEFLPERFLNQDGELNNDSVALAFGFGRRVWQDTSIT